MILSVPVIYRFCLTVVFFVVYRLVYGCILTYFVSNVNNSNYYHFIEFIYLCFKILCQKRKEYALHIWNFPLYKKECAWHVLAPRAVACGNLHLRASEHL